VRLLLETLNDPYPTPRGALEPDSGPAASRYLPCETCRAQGEVRVRGGWQLCLLCDGRGWRRRGRGDPEYDAYLEMPLAEAVSLPVAAPKRVRLPEAVEPEAYAWERARASYDRHGSYRLVRRGLVWLAVEHPPRHRLVQAVLVDHEPRVLDGGATADLDLGVVMIALRVPRVRVPPWLIERSAKETQLTIEGLAEAGLRAGEIARRLGLTKEAVRRRLKRKTVGSLHHAGVPRGAT